MENLFKELKKANLNPTWNDDDDFYPDGVTVLTDVADYEISKAAGGNYSVKRSEPFKENEFYVCCDTDEVISLIKADEEE